MKDFLNRKLVLSLFIVIIFSALLSACGTSMQDEEDDLKNDSSLANQTDEEESQEIKDHPIVTITMEDGSEMVAELYPEIAPNTVHNFIALIEDGFYDGLIFHRVIPGFMIQGGDPDGVGTGGPGYGIKGEFSDNGFENDLLHEKGVLSMARSNHPDSAGSQFFIMADKSSSLDGNYASFGEVIEGIEVVDTIVNAKSDGNDKPLEDQRIKTITVDTKGYEYPEPEIIN